MPSDHDHNTSAQAAGVDRIVRVAVLGSTGSIGTQTLETIKHLNALNSKGQHPTRYEVVALCANSDTTTLKSQANANPDATLGVCDLRADTSALDGPSVIHDPDAPKTLVEQTNPDLVIAAIVGIAGLPSTLRAAQLGINIALANKESLVAGGKLVTEAAVSSGASILPIDSEHAGLWQCLLSLNGPDYTPPSSAQRSINRVTLTASGGPFRDQSLEDIQNATVEQALKHPTWSMGQKVSIDSATLMNKALELIEAHWLFGLSAEQLDAVIHPQSTVHAFVETIDGSTLAHLGPTDMRCPIQHALTHPDRAPLQSEPLDLTTLSSLDFTSIDPERFPAIGLAKRVISAGSSAGTVFNAANEAAVESFLNHQLRFGDITAIVKNTLDRYDHHAVDTLDAILDTHEQAKSIALDLIQSIPHAAR